eukprot:5212097-Lingulodinium_polyedra.AAC.1
MVVFDPYLAAVSSDSELYGRLAACESSEDFPDIPLDRLERASSLWLLRELLETVEPASRRLSKVTLVTRADLMQDRGGRLHAGPLVRRWAALFQEEFCDPRHMEFELLVDPSVHCRRILLQGRASGVEIRL